MSYFGFMGMNGPTSYGNYSNNGATSPTGGPNHAKPSTDSILLSSAEKNTTAQAPAQKKTGISGFFQGMKNGLVNTVKGLFTVKGALMTAATIGLVAATGGAALLPLVLMGVGLGGYQVAKGVVKGDTEQMGEGAFTLGASLLGAKISPNTIGGNTLADTSLIGKLKAPFGGKGTFSNSDATFLSASKEATSKTFSSLKGKLQSSNAVAAGDVRTMPATSNEAIERVMSKRTGFGAGPKSVVSDSGSNAPSVYTNARSEVSSVYEDAIAPEDSISNAGDSIAQNKPGFGQKIGNWFSKAWNRPGMKKTRDYFVPNSGGSNPQSPQSPGNGTQVTFGERAQGYLQEAKKSPQVATSWISTIFGAKKQPSTPAEGGTTYY